MKKLHLLCLSLTSSAFLFSTNIQAQDNGNGNGGGRSNREQFREQMSQRLKTELKATDDEWKVLQPLIENVFNKQRESLSTNFGGLGGMMGRNRNRNGQRRGEDGNTNGQTQSSGAGAATQTSNATGGGDNSGSGSDGNRQGRNRASSPEIDALKKALESDQTPTEEIKAKLTELHNAREKSQDELKAAREDLRKVVTLRQEAVLVLYGILD